MLRPVASLRGRHHPVWREADFSASSSSFADLDPTSTAVPEDRYSLLGEFPQDVLALRYLTSRFLVPPLNSFFFRVKIVLTSALQLAAQEEALTVTF